MGEWHCSRFAIMQLFHELKQQFPTLPDHVVSRCITQNNYDRETCARSLRATEESRPPPGAFPPPPPRLEPASVDDPVDMDDSDSPIPKKPAMLDPRQRLSLGPLSLDINSETLAGSSSAPTAPLTVDVSCCPIEDPEASDDLLREYDIKENDESLMRPVLMLAALPEESTPELSIPEVPSTVGEPALESTRGLSTINLTLMRSPDAFEPKPPTTFTSNEGFQSNLNVSIGRGKFGPRPATIRPPPVPQRPSSLIYPSFEVARASGLQLKPNRAAAASAPTTPSFPDGSLKILTQPTSSLPTTPSVSGAPDGLLPGPPTLEELRQSTTPRRYEITRDDDVDELTPESVNILEEAEELYKPVIKEQLVRYDRLNKALGNEKEKLEDLRKEIEGLETFIRPDPSSVKTERQLRSEIYQLQVECDKLTEQIDRRSDSQIPLGETSEEFYNTIYTGQQFNPDQLNPEPSNSVPPPLPSQPPAWEPDSNEIVSQEDQDGPSWVCLRCTFDNHPLMSSCEQCELPKTVTIETQGQIPDIHIRVTRHHNFPPRRTVHNWVV